MGKRERLHTMDERSSGRLLDHVQQRRLTQGREKSELARAIADRNRWFIVAVTLSVGIIVTGYGWIVAEARYANNVQVEWVKLDPSGGYTVEFYEENRPIQFFESTLNAKLMEFVDRRYSKLRETITQDYGFAYVMMSYDLRTDFLEEHHADRIAAKHEQCEHCDQIEVKTRVVNHIDDHHTPATESADQNIYTSMAYATETVRHRGRVMDRKNKIVKLVWRFKTKPEIIKEKKNLRFNPLGMEIVAYDFKDDPNTLPKEDQ